jgi:hypothetical protein
VKSALNGGDALRRALQEEDEDTFKRELQEEPQQPWPWPLPTSVPKKVPLATTRRSLREDLAVLFPLFPLVYFVFGLIGIELCRALRRSRRFNWVLRPIVVFPFVDLRLPAFIVLPILPLRLAAFICSKCDRAIHVFRFNAPRTAKKRRAVAFATLSAFVVTIASAALFKTELEEIAAVQHFVIFELGRFDLLAIIPAAWGSLRTACMSAITTSDMSKCSFFSAPALGHWFGSVAMTLSPSPGATLVWIAIFFWSFGVGLYFASHTERGSFFVLMAAQVVATLMLSLLLVPLRALVQAELYAVWCALEILLGAAGLWYIAVSATFFHGFESLRMIRERYIAIVDQLLKSETP